MHKQGIKRTNPGIATTKDEREAGAMYGRKVNDDLSKRELDAARLGFKQLLRCKRFSPQFINRHGDELFATATLEYSRKLAEGEKIENPPGWLIACAWRRTKSQLEAEARAPRVVSTEQSGPVVDEENRGPEDILLDEDRFRKVREAVSGLSKNQRRILAYSYFEGYTVREAGRLLRWHSSKAQRAHEGAKRRIHKLLGVSSSDDLLIEVGLAAWLSITLGSAGASGRLPVVHEVVDRGTQKVAEGLASLKQQATTAVRAGVDVTPFAGARPGTTLAVLGSCLMAVGGTAKVCVDQGVNPLGAARNLIASTAGTEEPPSEAPEEPAAPVYTPAAPPPVEEPPVVETPEPEPTEAPEPKEEPEPPPPEEPFEPVSEPEEPEIYEPREPAPVENEAGPAAVAASAPPEFGGPG